LNRRPSCAPSGFWTRTDISAHQDPGSQQVYGTDAFRSPSVRVVPAIHTDHDVLLVCAMWRQSAGQGEEARQEDHDRDADSGD
ncbi:MAG TPA: hypothetical protein VEV45_17330, partial [Streptosporangiaceae bacterium]|nr:hypothetical protein [Streptosporangiaceae bacterium]